MAGTERESFKLGEWLKFQVQVKDLPYDSVFCPLNMGCENFKAPFLFYIPIDTLNSCALNIKAYMC